MKVSQSPDGRRCGERNRVLRAMRRILPAAEQLHGQAVRQLRAREI
jgi:hypothetical protein